MTKLNDYLEAKRSQKLAGLNNIKQKGKWIKCVSNYATSLIFQTPKIIPEIWHIQ